MGEAVPLLDENPEIKQLQYLRGAWGGSMCAVWHVRLAAFVKTLQIPKVLRRTWKLLKVSHGQVRISTLSGISPYIVQ